MTLQHRVQDVLDELVATGAETGLQVAVHHRGDRVRPRRHRRCRRHDRTAGDPADLVLQLLHCQGRGRVDRPPAGQGRPGRLRHAGGGGVAGVRGARQADRDPAAGADARGGGSACDAPAGSAPPTWPNWPRVCAAIAGAQPRWRPGTRTGYHSFTFGFLVGEIARRVTGQPVRRLLHDWVAAPLGIVGELYFGVPPTELARLARLEDAEPHPAEPAEHDSILAPWERQPRASMGNSPDFLQADVPSVGTFTARGIATVYAAILDGPLIAADQLAELSAVAFEGTDQVFGNPARLALGYPLGRVGAPADEAPTTFGWPGGGGQLRLRQPRHGDVVRGHQEPPHPRLRHRATPLGHRDRRARPARLLPAARAKLAPQDPRSRSSSRAPGMLDKVGPPHDEEHPIH